MMIATNERHTGKDGWDQLRSQLNTYVSFLRQQDASASVTTRIATGREAVVPEIGFIALAMARQRGMTARRRVFARDIVISGQVIDALSLMLELQRILPGSIPLSETVARAGC